MRLNFGYPFGTIEVMEIIAACPSTEHAGHSACYPRWKEELPDGAVVLAGPVYADFAWRALIAVPLRDDRTGLDIGEALSCEGSARVLRLLLSPWEKALEEILDHLDHEKEVYDLQEASDVRGLPLGGRGAVVLWQMYSRAHGSEWLMGSQEDYERALDLIDD